MGITTDIEQAIRAAIPDAVIAVRNPSGGHFEIDVRSAVFAGKTALQQQRMVYSAISHLMKGDNAPVHAVDKLRIETPGVSMFLMSPPQGDDARRQWDALGDAVTKLGGQVQVMAPDPQMPGLVQAAFAGLPLAGKRFMLSRLRSRERRIESDKWATCLTALGWDIVAAPADYFEGQADVVTHGDAHIVCCGPGSARAGAEAALGALAAQRGLALELRIPASNAFWAFLSLPKAERLMVCPEVLSGAGMPQLDARFGGDRLLRISLEELRLHAAGSLIINDVVLASAALPQRVEALLVKVGYRVERLALDLLNNFPPRALVCVL